MSDYDFKEFNVGNRKIIIQKCSKCDAVVERSQRRSNVTCFLCKMKRNRSISKRIRDEKRERRIKEAKEKKCILCGKLGVRMLYCSDKCRRDYHNLSYAEKYNMEKL